MKNATLDYHLQTCQLVDLFGYDSIVGKLSGKTSEIVINYNELYTYFFDYEEQLPGMALP